MPKTKLLAQRLLLTAGFAENEEVFEGRESVNVGNGRVRAFGFYCIQ